MVSSLLLLDARRLIIGLGLGSALRTIPYHTIPYHTIPYYTIPYYSISYHAVTYHATPRHIIPHPTTPCDAVLCFTIPLPPPAILYYARLYLLCYNITMLYYTLLPPRPSWRVRGSRARPLGPPIECVHVYVYVYVYVYVCVCVYIYIYISNIMYTHKLYMYICVHVYTYIYIYIYMHTISIFIYLSLPLSLYIYIYIYTYISRGLREAQLVDPPVDDAEPFSGPRDGISQRGVLRLRMT